MKRIKWFLKKGITVKIISGKHKGETGEILDIIREKEMVVIKGINFKKKHFNYKKTGKRGVLWLEKPIHKSNVAVA